MRLLSRSTTDPTPQGLKMLLEEINRRFVKKDAILPHGPLKIVYEGGEWRKYECRDYNLSGYEVIEGYGTGDSLEINELQMDTYISYPNPIQSLHISNIIPAPSDPSINPKGMIKETKSYIQFNVGEEDFIPVIDCPYLLKNGNYMMLSKGTYRMEITEVNGVYYIEISKYGA